MNVNKSLFRILSQFTKSEIKSLSELAQNVVKDQGLHIKRAPKLLEVGRVLIIIPKRYGKAFERNLLRRRIKHIFYEEKLYEKPFDWVIVAGSRAKNLSYKGIKEILINSLKNEDSPH